MKLYYQIEQNEQEESKRTTQSYLWSMAHIMVKPSKNERESPEQPEPTSSLPPSYHHTILSSERGAPPTYEEAIDPNAPERRSRSIVPLMDLAEP
uniref:Uncharacterized protein n=1 Tax=Timema bartmani TaxID=61472 RepID=A0A7R9FA22_9NEOP|nr:unnamed protein product [Timema bartmani]